MIERFVNLLTPIPYFTGGGGYLAMRRKKGEKCLCSLTVIIRCFNNKKIFRFDTALVMTNTQSTTPDLLLLGTVCGCEGLIFLRICPWRASIMYV